MTVLQGVLQVTLGRTVPRFVSAEMEPIVTTSQDSAPVASASWVDTVNKVHDTLITLNEPNHPKASIKFLYIFICFDLSIYLHYSRLQSVQMVRMVMAAARCVTA